MPEFRLKAEDLKYLSACDELIGRLRSLIERHPKVDKMLAAERRALLKDRKR